MYGVSSILSTLQGKILAGVLATSIVAGGGALAVTSANVLSDPEREASSSVASEVEAESGRGRSTSASQSASAQADESGAEGSAGTTAGRTGVGSAAIGAGPGVAILSPSGAGGGGQLGIGGGSRGGGWAPSGALTGVSVPNQPNVGTTPAPSTGSIPSEIAVHRSGSHSVVVPATEGDAQQLCLKGEIDRCRTITVPATKGVIVTFSYDANASTTVPVFTVSPCERGVEIAVQGLTQGATVGAEAEGVTLTADVTGGKEIVQAASFCKA